jgi:lipopolysaccharide/colanic/teichoic acid biosynthesis glycosyltransferase
MQNEALASLILKKDPDALCLAVKNHYGYYTIKRILDTIIAFCLLMLLLPIMIVIALLIFVYSPGPVFFVQKRVGVKRHFFEGQMYWKKENFNCFKFRTMKVNSDPAIHQAYVKALIENDEAEMTALQGAASQPRKLVNDPRIIAPGKLLRKLSLDELPQLWNVFIGDMSLIGPRPAIPYEVELYKPFHMRRLEAQPGITGLQQVYARSSADFDKQVQFDIDYIDNQSLWLDLKILLKTPLVVISTKGAY